MMPLPEENCAKRVKHERRNLVVFAPHKNSFDEDESLTCGNEKKP